MTGGKVQQYPHFVRLFHTSTPLRSVSNEVRSEETLDFMASAGHGSYSLHHSGGVM